MFEKEIPTRAAAARTPTSIFDSHVRETLAGTSLPSKAYHPSPAAWEDQQLYFLLPDRFSNGQEDGALNMEGKPIQGDVKLFTNSDSGNAKLNPDDAKRWEEQGVIFQGGTLKGIESKLGYLKRLGVTALWVGPIFKQVPNDNYLYHGYAVQNFLDIDPHFGTREDLRDLVQTAHEQGIYVILDIILNHSGDVFTYVGGEKRWDGRRFDVEGYRDSTGSPTLPFQPLASANLPKNPQDCAIWPVELQRPENFTREGAISNWDYYPEYIRGDFLSLKDIDLGSADVDNFTPAPALLTLSEVYKYWIAYADLDGYRIDTVKHMGDGPTRYLCTTLHEFASSRGKDNFFLVGEVTGGRAWETVESTGLNAALAVGNIQEKLWRMPKGDANPAEYFDLFRNATYLKKGTNAWMRDKLVTMIDDHDQVWRGGGVKTRFCSDPEGPKLALAAIGLNLTTLGIPCIYYGTEQRFDGKGGSDRYLREAMFGGSFGAFGSKQRHFFDESTSVFQEVGKISKVRQQHIALRRGRQYLREISSNGRDFGVPRILGGKMKSIVAWSRVFADVEIVCAINTDTENSTQAFVTIDGGLHAEGQALNCIYASPSELGQDAPKKVDVLSRNGKAIFLSLPPAGFVCYM
ncbi:alpha-amylase [Dendryphion nanum]|uniref:Alpha-amylase n=1 Tax=Dendryphion nanum TaxID=256645 RepID=A0A9P9I7H6_9PLEO|nr:alpha-amylase [Dendryphion nanum]